ncbi:MAG: ribosome small subunit-dependent GTPase A [Ignavibacteriaceae bacterium]|nr:ribosome small subunit-dependent GTPase A [Ignavibacteriaceae bacterium]
MYVKPEEGEDFIRCSLRGKFRIENRLKKDKMYILDVLAVGDYVSVSMEKDGTGVIEEVLTRTNYLSRKAPKLKGGSYRGERFEQIIAANISQVIVVFSAVSPSFNNRSLDRFLVAAESSQIRPMIVINKMDLLFPDERKIFDEIRDVYTELNYSVFLTSAVTKEGIDELREKLKKECSFVWGHSGVGKSSLFNVLYPGLNFQTGEISNYSDKGVHTTVTVSLHDVSQNTQIIDSPGIREIDPYGITKEDLCHYFREFESYLGKCRFTRCTHTHEPDCAIRDAVEQGEISPDRYESYTNIYNTVEEDLFF